MPTDNRFWLERLKGTGVLTRGARVELVRTGPILRAHRPTLGLRKGDALSSAYDKFDFEGDGRTLAANYDRFKVRWRDEQSVKIVEQAIDGSPRAR